MRRRDVLAGALMLNAIPHTINGLAGKRCMTQLGGANSPPAANPLWAGVNLAAGPAALAPSSWRHTNQIQADERPLAVTLGIVGAAVFSACYELTPAAAHHRRVRAQAAADLPR